jgi:amino acid adenylation domain-containing protein
MRERAIVVGETSSGPDTRAQLTETRERLESDRLLELCSGSSVNYPRNLGLHELVEAQVERTPDAEAVRFRNQSLTYRELNARANQLANSLRKRGVGRDVLVAVCAERSIEMVVALLASLKAGGAYLPLDPEFPTERLRAILEDANPPVVLTQSHLLDHVPTTKAHCLCLDSNWEEVAGESASNLGVEVGGKDLAYAIYTSGSTGKPKGVLNVHQGIINQLLWMQDEFPLEPSDRILQKSPFSFDISVWEFFWPLLNGALLVISDPGGHRDPDYLARLIREEQISIAHFVPSMLQLFLEAPGVEHCVSLRKVFTGGEALTYDIQQRFFERLQIPLINLYGPTEAAVDVTFFSCQRNSTDKTVPIGRPIANTYIVILDVNRQPVSIGVAGELNIGGVSLARGYLNQPELTAEKFLPNSIPELGTDRLYRTGDLARFMPDGNVEFLGRVDHQVKIRGNRIELGEIEAALKDQPEIAQAVVVVREDRPGDRRLAAYLLATDGAALESAELRRRLKMRLPDYMLPSSYTYLEEIPLTSNGKFDRNALPAPTEASADQTENFDPARNPVEEMLASIWAEVLGLPRVGIHDNFFDLGGHSITAVRFFAKLLSQVSDFQPSLALLLKAPTVEQFARAIQENRRDWSLLVPLREGNSRPPFFCVPGAGGNVLSLRELAMAMSPDQPVYCLQARGLDGISPPFSTAEETAEVYVDEIRKVQPHGPYFLGGGSYGGMIAFEMACRLQSMGETVGVLALLDASNPAYHRSLSTFKVLYLHARFFVRRILHHARTLPRLKLREWGWYLPSAVKTFVRLAGDLARIVKRESEDEILIAIPQAQLEALEGGGELEKTLSRVMDASRLAAQRFVPKPYDGHLLVFRATNLRYENPLEDETLGWGPLALGGVTTYEINGDHAAVFHKPHVNEIAKILDGALRAGSTAHQEGLLDASASTHLA